MTRRNHIPAPDQAQVYIAEARRMRNKTIAGAIARLFRPARHDPDKSGSL